MESREGIRVRRAATEDAEMVFAWRNRSEIIELGTSRREVTWDEHSAWFRNVVAGQRHLLLIVERNDRPIGQIRFDPVGYDAAEVSIFLVPECAGRGYGPLALRLGCWEAYMQLRLQTLLAAIRVENGRSIAAFQKCGFKGGRVKGFRIPDGHALFVSRRPVDVPHNRLTHGSAEARAVARTVRSGQWAAGARVEELEAALARIAGVAHAVCVSSGSAALRLALAALGVGTSDSVLVPAYSCVALPNAVLTLGATPVPVDVIPDDWNIDAARARETFEAKGARAVVAVNTFGAPAHVEELVRLGVPVIEDCAHAFGMNADVKALGGRTEAAVLSFHATKLIGSGEGGAVLTDDARIGKFVSDMRDYVDRPPGIRYNDRMTDLEASLALEQLERLPVMIEARERLARRYDTGLREIGGLARPDVSHRRIWYRYAVESREVTAAEAVARLRDWGVHGAQPVTDWRPKGGSAPVADRAYRSVVSLPLYPTLTDEEQERVLYAASRSLGAHERA